MRKDKEANVFEEEWQKLGALEVVFRKLKARSKSLW
jgi:hypothetical protein